jgi:hypothetical protein
MLDQFHMKLFQQRFCGESIFTYWNYILSVNKTGTVHKT